MNAGSQLRRGRAVLTRRGPQEHEVTGYLDGEGVERSRPKQMAKLTVRREHTAMGSRAGSEGWQVRVDGARGPYAGAGVWFYGSLCAAVEAMHESGMVLPPGGD